MEEKISDKLDKLTELIEEQKQAKKFKLPLGIRMGQGKIRKKNFCVIEFIRTNGSIDFKFVPIEDNTVKIGDIYYETTAKHILRYKKYPLIILPEWNISPISQPDGTTKEGIAPFDSEKNMQEAVDEGKLSAAEKFILHAIKMDLVKPKTTLNFKTVIIILAVLGIAAYGLHYLKVF